MTDNNAELAAEIASSVQLNFINGFCSVAAMTLVFYDHISTVSREVHLVWGRKFNAVTLLFHLNRWTIFVWAVSNCTNFIPIPTLVGYVCPCTAAIDWSYVIAILLLMIWAAFSSIRIYAVSTGSWCLALLVATVAMVPAATNIYLNLIKSQISIADEPFLGVECGEGFNVSNAVFDARESVPFRFPITDRSCAIAADVIVLLVTWSKTWSVKRSADRAGISTPLVTMLLKDGTVYFILLLALNIFQIVGWVTGIFLYAETYFTTPLSSIIITHFLLNLRQVGHSQVAHDTLSLSRPSFVRSLAPSTGSGSGRFASFVDGIGAELEYDADPDDVGRDWGEVFEDGDTVETEEVSTSDGGI
ncbi:hypothetical protein OBBRIDRAFT_833767 [Obba rivulosa]|uniref:DUF6533 domain-containing protein n=1 Tax=Obba rivulosa TaxID=1052685 RepID=A0A8E2DN50_9APHY|nr:hypothetical protein OBBRIDRAFT_833767 [Obba rivulosa]